MKKIVLITFVLVLLSTAAVIGFVRPVAAHPAKIIVPDDYEKIQWAVGNASAGDTIFVRAGTYFEHVTIDKSDLTLMGEDRSTTIIDGSGAGVVFGDLIAMSPAARVSISGFTIQNASYGILVYGSEHVITGNTITNCHKGIAFGASTANDNDIYGNIISNNEYGISLMVCQGNTISGNTITNNSWGIRLSGEEEFVCQQNIISNNLIANNEDGIHIESYSSGNTIYHNNFINNTSQVYNPGSKHVWDNSYPSGGNYWSNYAGIDLYNGRYQNVTGSDGIGDMSHILDADNKDAYPLMDPFSFFNACTYNEITYCVDTVSNSTVSDFYFSEHNRLISLNVAGPDGTVGFCRVTIPRELMWCDALEEWNVTVDGNPPIYLKAMEDANCTYLYFTYNHTTHNVKIISTYVISTEEEVPFRMQWWFYAIVAVGIAALAGAVYFLKKRKPPTPTAPPLPPEGTV